MIVIIILLSLHFIADFVCQPRWMGKEKSKNNIVLVMHVVFYSLIFLAAAQGIAMTHWELLPMIYKFVGITFVCHFITDYFSSRLGSKLWSQGKEYESLLILGADQLLHAIQLILTYYFLFL